MLDFLINLAPSISTILKAEIPCFYLDVFLILLFFLVYFVALKFFNYEVSNFYYVSFFGLFPYRLIKAVFGSHTILIVSLPFLFGVFCLIWRYINFVIPFFFKSYFGQSLVAFSLLLADKFLFLFNILKQRIFILVFYVCSFIAALYFCWESLEYSSFFMLTLVQSFAWYINLYRHFLSSKAIEIFKKEAFLDEWPKEPSDFKWEHMTYIIYHVLKHKHNYRVLNQLGPIFTNFRYPNIAKFCFFPLNDTTNTISSSKLNYRVVGGALIFSFGWIEVSRAKIRVSNLEKLVQNKRNSDVTAEKQILEYQEEIIKFKILANNYLREYEKAKKKLEEMGVKNLESVDFSDTTAEDKMFDPSVLTSSWKGNPFKVWSKKKILEIENLTSDLNFYKIQYILTIERIEKRFLRQSCLKNLIDCDVEVIEVNRLERFFTSNNETFHYISALDLKADKLQEKAEKNSEIQALLKKTFQTKECVDLEINDIEKLNMQIYPFLSTLLEEYKQEVLNESMNLEPKEYDKRINFREAYDQPTLKSDLEESSSHLPTSFFWES